MWFDITAHPTSRGRRSVALYIARMLHLHRTLVHENLLSKLLISIIATNFQRQNLVYKVFHVIFFLFPFDVSGT